MSDQSGRPLLPQSNVINIRPVPPPSSTEHVQGQKNFVFVNEHDRQKRLKVMRACEACRKRKIKCDAVTTNSWPCSKCQRSNLECVPPTSDGTISSDTDLLPETSRDDVKLASLRPPDDMSASYVWSTGSPPMHPPHSLPNVPYTFSMTAPNMVAAPPPPQPPPPQPPQYPATVARSYTEPYEVPAPDFANYQPFAQSRADSVPLTSSNGAEGSWRGQSPEEDLSGAMGDLKINQTAVAPYMVNNRALAEGPAIEETEITLPPSAQQGSTVRIPDEMMPSEEQALKYFNYYFDNVHPYVPVLNRNYFLMQWAQDRNSISPLILEGIFACATQMLHQPEERARWGALAARHEESFKDVPRLSTLQGMLILLKSKEAVPKRGYYYRSWMSVVNMVAMAKDLDLHEHFEMHQLGHPCDPGDGDCALKTKIWHTLFLLEIMVGGPQGRHEFGAHPDTVDFKAPQTAQTLDESELKIFQDFTQLMRVAANVRESNQLYARLRKKKTDWAADPDFVAHAVSYDKWPDSLPAHLQITYPPDGSPPWLPFHVTGNYHSYHWLGVLMHHRPMLQYATETGNVTWRQEQMRVCYEAATRLCRLQEAIVTGFGLEGLMCMMRGVNFTIYCVLTCTMFHLVAITSPDPELNTNAAGYFTRHMRILEQCTDAWPMEEVRRQIDSIRQAFSADLSKPFELKPNFPYGSPGRSVGTPSSEGSHPSEFAQADLRTSLPYNPNAMTPPTSAGHGIMANDYGPPTSQPYSAAFPADMAASQASMQAQWNPSRIIDQWSIAFSPPSASQSTPSASSQTPQHVPMQQQMYSQSPQQGQNQLQQPHEAWVAAYQGGQNNMTPSPLAVPIMPQQMHATTPSPQPALPYAQNAQSNRAVPMQSMYDGMPNLITPSMWQEAVLQSYPEGLKRRGGTSISGPSGKRAR